MEQKELCTLSGTSIHGISTGKNIKCYPLLQLCGKLQDEGIETIVFTFFSTIGSFSTILEAAEEFHGIEFMVILFGMSSPRNIVVPDNVRICSCVINKNGGLSVCSKLRNRDARFLIRDSFFEGKKRISTWSSEQATQIVIANSRWLRGTNYYVVNFGFRDKTFMDFYTNRIFQLIDPSRTYSKISDVILIVGTGVTTICFFKALQQLGLNLKFHLVQVGKAVDEEFIKSHCEGIQYQIHISSCRYLEKLNLDKLNLPDELVKFGANAEHYDGKILEFCNEIADSLSINEGKKGLLMLSVI